MYLMAEKYGSDITLKDVRERLGVSVKKFSEMLDVPTNKVHNYVYGGANTPANVLEKAKRLLKNETGPPLIPASELQIPIPYIGSVAASGMDNWCDPFESEVFEFVPPEMGDPKGRFCCHVIGDSMYPLLVPGDLCVFHRTDIPKIGAVVLFRSFENKVTIKTLKHDGRMYILHAENPEYEDVTGAGSMVGYLVGIVRQQGAERMTRYNPHGITS